MGLMNWENVPEPILVRVLSYVTVADIANSALVCQRWCEICKENSLWRGLLKRRFGIVQPGLKVRCRGLSWKEEYRRLVYLTPVVCSQTLRDHRDEVLHVAFSNSGANFVTCSKDASVIIWKLIDLTAVLEHKVNMRKHLWRYTWSSKYNSTDSLLLVSGVVSDINGEIAILKKNTSKDNVTIDYSVLCRVNNNPYDVMGDWVSNTHFLSGKLDDIDNHVWPSATLLMCEADPSLPSNTTSPSASLAIKNIVLRLQGDNTVYLRCLHVTDRNIFPDQSLFSDKSNRVSLSAPQDVDMSCKDVLSEKQICLIFLANCESLAAHQLGFCMLRPEDLLTVPLVRTPDRVINMEGHIVGLSLSPDARYLYVNVRRWPANSVLSLFDSPAIANEIEMRVVDLETLTLLDIVYMGHKGFTDSQEAFYIYINVSEDMVSSGSEDTIARIWDRHYGCCVAQLRHEKCVNAAAFSTSNQQLMVTVSDDNTVKVWQSRNLMKHGETI